MLPCELASFVPSMIVQGRPPRFSLTRQQQQDTCVHEQQTQNVPPEYTDFTVVQGYIPRPHIHTHRKLKQLLHCQESIGVPLQRQAPHRPASRQRDQARLERGTVRQSRRRGEGSSGSGLGRCRRRTRPYEGSAFGRGSSEAVSAAAPPSLLRSEASISRYTPCRLLTCSKPRRAPT